MSATEVEDDPMEEERKYFLGGPDMDVGELVDGGVHDGLEEKI